MVRSSRRLSRRFGPYRTIDVGVWAPDPYSQSTWATELDAFEANAGHIPTIIFTYVGWAGTNTTFPAAHGNYIRSRGAQWCLTWEPWDPSGTVNQASYTLASTIGGSHDAYITQFALDIKNWGYPLLLRFAHEMNGDWYPWSEGVNGNSASGSGQFASMWRHVRDIFTAQGVTNVRWVWSPYTTFFTDPMAPMYPGDSYVDWIGLDGYNWGTVNGKTWTTFEQTFSAGITEILAVTSTKPLHLCEIASTETGGDKAAWITDMWTRLAARPEIKGFWWFNHNKETDWRIQSSTAAAAAYAAGVSNARYKTGIHLPTPKTAMLTDNFNGALDPARWTATGGAASNGTQLAIALGTSYPTILSVVQYDLTASTFTLEVVQVGNAVTSAQTFCMMNTPAANKTGIEIVVDAAATLRARRWVNNVATELANTPYSATNHRWWRFRESGGTTYWETCATATGTWATVASIATSTLTGLGIDLTKVNPALGAGTWQIETNPGTALFDNVN